MHAQAGRRDFVRLLLAALAAPAVAGSPGLPWTPRVRAQAHDAIGVVPLAPSVRLVSGAGGNVVVLRGADGVVMVNGGAREHAPRLLAEIAAATGGGRVQALFNTDWHPDHTGANELLGPAGTPILAHEHTKQYLGAELFVDWQNRTYTPLPAPARPTQTFYGAGTMTSGGERIDYGPLGQAHTDGDIYVFFRDSNVLVAGDVMTVGSYPIADYTTGGWLGGLATATKTLLDLCDGGTRVVPGHGPVQTRGDLEAQHQMLVATRDKLSKMMRQGLGADDMLAAGVTREFDARWGSPDLFVTTGYRGLWLHVRELGGVV